ncbi:MAG: ABC transporter substrate-binding protein [Syntrophales bacterium]|nr:ABC transporter substrate-binding protein [Syntrophales bacterium]
MKYRLKKLMLIVICSFCLLLSGIMTHSVTAADAKFDVNKLSDMSDFDPNDFVNPTGDTIKIGIMQIFSGAGAGNGELFWAVNTWVAHDINKRGGILVDGNKKKIELLKGDTKSSPVATKKEVEKLCLQDDVDLIWGTSGTHLALVIQNTAQKYKKIFMNCLALSDQLMDAPNFNRYTFRTIMNTSMHGLASGYYMASRPETKFYILCQDYSFGHAMAEGFKAGLKKYKPEAEIVGEEYHPLFMKDFAPYITKIMGSGADCVYTADWLPDAGNLLKQSRDLGMKLPFVNLFMDEPNGLAAVGPEGTKGLLHVNQFMSVMATPDEQKFGMAWNNAWKSWKKPYNTLLYKWAGGTIGKTLADTYWLLSVVERAGSTDAEKIIPVWEGDEYEYQGALYTMRACDHQAYFNCYASEYIYPNLWFEELSGIGNMFIIPARYCMPPLPENLDRCKK